MGRSLEVLELARVLPRKGDAALEEGMDGAEEVALLSNDSVSFWENCCGTDSV